MKLKDYFDQLWYIIRCLLVAFYWVFWIIFIIALFILPAAIGAHYSWLFLLMYIGYILLFPLWSFIFQKVVLLGKIITGDVLI